MNAMSRTSIALLAALALPPAGAAAISCHIHLPPEHPAAGGKPTIIPNVGDPQRCEALNAERYDGQGRCHCSFSAGPAGPGRPGGTVEPPAGPPGGLP